MSDPADTWRANLGGTLNLGAAVAQTAPTATFVFVSSGEVYGRAFTAGQPLRETAAPEPVGVHARSKDACELMLADMIRPEGRLVVLRPFNHVGPGQDERFVAASFAGRTRPVSDLLDGFRRMARVPVEVRQDPKRLRANGIPRACGDNHALADAIGWNPHDDLDMTLLSVLDDARGRCSDHARQHAAADP